MRTKEKSTNVFFLRHGQTDFPTNRIYCDDKIDPALNFNGIYQAKKTAALLYNESISRVYCSPALRTCMTADQFTELADIEVKQVPRWVERRFGIWEGLFFEEIEQTFPEDYLKWKKDKINYTPKGGETIVDVSNRLKSSLADIVAQHQGENILIVSHVGPIRISVCDALKIPIEQYRQLNIDYASLTRIDYGIKNNNLIYLNRKS